MRSLALASLLALLLLPAVQAQEVPIPGTGPLGTPAFIDLPKTCDPVGLVCVGPVHAPAPVGVAIDGDGFILIVDPDGNPGSTVPPTYQNVTVGAITVPVVLCPNACTIPATPSGGLEGDASVSTSGPVACTVTLRAAPDCDPLLECDPLDGCGVPDEEEFCLRDDFGSPECFVPVVGPCDPLEEVACVLALVDLALDTAGPVVVIVLDLAGDVIGLVPEPNDLCVEGGSFPDCVLALVPPIPCADDVVACAVPWDTGVCVGYLLPVYCVPAGARPLLETLIPECTPEIKAQPVYICRMWLQNLNGEWHERIVVNVDPLNPVFI